MLCTYNEWMKKASNDVGTREEAATISLGAGMIRALVSQQQ
jgi:hypothetical protein